ncbi:MAG: ribonuclease Y, partial [Patescibacteria group bacterium]
EARNQAVKILEDAKVEEKEKIREIKKIEDRLDRQEVHLSQQQDQLIKKAEEVRRKMDEIEGARQEVQQIKEKEVQLLQKIAELTPEKAKEILFTKVEDMYKSELISRMQKLEQDANKEIDQRAKEMLATVVQRYAGSQVSELSTTVVQIPSDDIKGKIIGREGRNIRTLERYTGAEFLIDDTPETVIISSFDPVRRQVAKLALEKLIADGRIQPARIEEFVEKAKEDINEKIQEAGEEACYDIGVVGLNPKLIYLLGRLHFRTSFGQNVLMHSKEMAHISGMLAAELGANVKVAKMGALFHDIGKAVDHEVQGTHVEIGRKILQKFNIDEEVIKAMQAHHEEYPYETVESIIVQVADRISGARPGARRDTTEIYLKRLEDLEKIAMSFEGVEKSYAVQAGREIRVFVMPEKIDDLQARKLARDVADKIQEEMQYPGEIKINVIRESRSIEYAR